MLSKANRPEAWSVPHAPEDVVEPRAVGGPDLVADMLTATSYVGRRQGRPSRGAPSSGAPAPSSV